MNTRSYWRNWVKHCSIPTHFQQDTIRSALSLKLHCYEDTGAILAATTTSLPEELGGTRNWDYRYCWLRDAYFVLSALHRLGHFEEMEGFLKFLLGIVESSKNGIDRLAPVYTLSQALPLPEHSHTNWLGYKGSSPIRTHNQAAEHIQNDVYGEMILTLAPIYFDHRFFHLRSEGLEKLLVQLGQLCERSLFQPDAGLWEVRHTMQEHTFTHMMSWAGLDRLSRMAPHGLNLNGFDVQKALQNASSKVVSAAKHGVLRNGLTDDSFDASLLLAPVLNFPHKEISEQTVDAIATALAFGNTRERPSFFYRYRRPDDFGTPQSSFVICSFWMVQALSKLGRHIEAKQLLEKALSSANHVGLFSEHFLPSENLQLGNFPQAYSHVGLINAAFSVSPPWEEIL